MITPIQLVYKIKRQSTFLEKYLNLPKGFGEEPLAKAIYQAFSYDDLCSTILDFGYKIPDTFISAHKNLRYLLISEIDDQELIKELHKEIEQMALRIEEQVIINITRVQLVSILYKLFGLEYESKYILKLDEISLNWEPYFQTLTDNKAVMFSDLKINGTPFRLIATKLDFEEFSIDSFTKLVPKGIKQHDNIGYEDIDNHISWLISCTSLFTPFGSKNSDESPHFYRIDGDQYVIYGFPLSPIVCTDKPHELLEINTLVKNAKEKQVYILNLEYQKLTIESLMLDGVNRGGIIHSQFSQELNDSLLNHNDASALPLVFHESCYLLWIRPYRHLDFLKNAI